jgi:hypothetical protein
MRPRTSAFLAFLLLSAGWRPLLAEQNKATHPRVVALPKGDVSRIPSPDGKWTLIFECPHECSERKLWIVENGAEPRRLAKEYERSLSVSWAPDSRHFFVNDAWGSDGESCSVYETATLKSVDIADVLLSANADVKWFLNAGHSYIQATRWVDADHLIVVLFGHFDDPPLGGFTIRYRVDVNGDVHKLSQKRLEEEPH